MRMMSREAHGQTNRRGKANRRTDGATRAIEKMTLVIKDEHKPRPGTTTKDGKPKQETKCER